MAEFKKISESDRSVTYAYKTEYEKYIYFRVAKTDRFESKPVC